MIAQQKNTKKFIYSRKNPGVMSNSDPIRSLRKTDLGGVVFSCTHSTIAECHRKQLFGLPSKHIIYVRNIEEGLPLFLFNYSNRKMYGLYVAAGPGQLNINPYAWTDNGSERTPFPSQVAIHIKTPCHPLEESEYRSVIFDNYYDPEKFNNFWFELDHAQTRSLTALFKPSRNPINLRPPSDNVSGTDSQKRPQKVDIENKKKGKEVKLQESDEETISDWEVLAEGGASNSYSNSNESGSNGDKRVMLGTQENEREKDNLVVILQQMVANRQRRDLSSSRVVGRVEACSSSEKSGLVNDSGLYEYSSSAHHELLQTIRELQGCISYLQSKQAQSAQVTAQLKKKIEQYDHKISSLRFRVRSLESTHKALYSSSTSAPPDNDNLLQQFVEQCLGSDNVIYLVGGNNGNKFLSDFDSFSPSLDVLTSLRPMSSAKSYMAVAALDGKIYVAGGYDGSWFDTVECYDRRKDAWAPQPSLIHEKGCLSGVTIDGKIYVLGGKNSSEYFSEVDMLDPILGKWISFIPMLEKRSTFGAGVLNGAIYAVGGYDGTKYLRTGERLDLREPYWKKIPNMNSRRGCHSLSVLNDKIYAVGGYDGRMATSTVESYDPRMLRWVMTEPMNCARGYVTTAVLGGSLYAIGGANNDLMLDTVESYQDGSDWIYTGLKAMGKRSCSAIAL